LLFGESLFGYILGRFFDHFRVNHCSFFLLLIEPLFGYIVVFTIVEFDIVVVGNISILVVVFLLVFG
jgi:hypothetical protein